jgi:hypothetical protein
LGGERLSTTLPEGNASFRKATKKYSEGNLNFGGGFKPSRSYQEWYKKRVSNAHPNNTIK